MRPAPVFSSRPFQHPQTTASGTARGSRLLSTASKSSARRCPKATTMSTPQPGGGSASKKRQSGSVASSPHGGGIVSALRMSIARKRGGASGTITTRLACLIGACRQALPLLTQAPLATHAHPTLQSPHMGALASKRARASDQGANGDVDHTADQVLRQRWMW